MPNGLESPKRNEIQCELFEYSLQDRGTGTHLYEALSYIWGGEKKPCSITIKGQNLNVTQNLYTALLSKIYSKAARILIWLGETALNSDMALETIRIAAEDEKTDSLNNKEIQQAILTLLGQECSITSLIKRSIFWLKHTISLLGRDSLNICPLYKLVDMFYTYKATKPVDKVYALLGISSDNPSIAGLLPDYKIPWKELFKDIVRYILGKDISIKISKDSQRAIIKSKGYILGQVSLVRSGDRQRHDIICLIQGASNPTIIRLYKDHFAIIVVIATPLNKSENFGWPEIS
ncbi:hypothetical protein B0J14DRAFT_630682 [Halenospora varia]|nr:hypothetical protein B0J14DRAFT_630682 [Halenospora varia]